MQAYGFRFNFVFVTVIIFVKMVCGTSREIWCCEVPHARWFEERNENCENDGMMDHKRWDRVFSATCVGVPWQLRPDQRNLVRPVVPEAEAE